MNLQQTDRQTQNLEVNVQVNTLHAYQLHVDDGPEWSQMVRWDAQQQNTEEEKHLEKK